jgi:transposase-like protein
MGKSDKKKNDIVPVCDKCRSLIDINVSLETVMKQRFLCGDCAKGLTADELKRLLNG